MATRAEPFKGKIAAQVIGMVLYKAERPQLPEGASASPHVVPLMELCWKQDPADRPEGFGPVVRTLASALSRVGDPRNDSAAAADVKSSSGVNGDVTAPTVGGVDASSSWSDLASRPAGSTTSPLSNDSGSDQVEGDIPRRPAEETVLSDAGKVHVSFADLPIASKVLPPSSRANSGRFKNRTGTFGQQLRKKVRNSYCVRFQQYDIVQ